MTGPLPLTFGRKLALAIGTPLALFSFAAVGLDLVAAVAQDSYHVSLTAPIRGGTASITVGSGRIILRPGTAGALRLAGTAHYTFTRPRVSWQNTPGGVIVNTQCRQINYFAGECSFDFTAAVPPGVSAQVSDRAGDLEARGLATPLTLESGSGDIRLQSLSGDVHVHGRAGNITGSGLTGAVLGASADAGQISLTGVASPDVTVSNRAGGIIVAFTEIPRYVRISNDAGDVSLLLPRSDTGYNIQTDLSAGNLTVGPGVVRNPASQHVISVTDRAGNVTITE